jgi:hypothetical protein
MRLKDRYLHVLKDVESISVKHKVSIEEVHEQIAIGEIVEKEHTQDRNKAINIAIDHLKENINYYNELAEMEALMFQKKLEMRNEKEFPTMYYTRHIQAGVVKYKNEMVLVENDTLKKMMPNMIGIPVFVDHQDVDLENLKAQSDGYVTESFYNEKDGWFWAKFIAVTDKAKEAIKNGWRVSNDYFVIDSKGGGSWHNVDYDREILDGEYSHLAIVDNPRYEEARIMTCDEFKKYNLDLENELKELKNSKEATILKTGGSKIMKFFTKKKEEVNNIDEISVELSNGKEMTVTEMVNAMEESKKEEEKKNSDSKVDENTKVNVCGSDMTLKELKNKYEDMMNKKKNEDEKAEKEKADKEAEEKKNADDAAAKKKEEEEKKNSKNFDEMKNAIADGDGSALETKTYETRDEKLKRGQDRY